MQIFNTSAPKSDQIQIHFIDSTAADNGDCQNVKKNQGNGQKFLRSPVRKVVTTYPNG